MEETPVVTYENDDAVIAQIATEAERAGLKELREAINPHLANYLTPEQQKYNELTGDLRLLRYYRGYKGVVKDATAAYVKMLTWYKRDKIGDIRDDIVSRKLTLSKLPDNDLIHKHFYTNVWHREDRFGNLLNYELTGRVVPKDFLKDISYDVFMNWQRYHMEFKILKLTELSHKHKLLVRSVIVKDLEGYQPILALLKDALQMATDNYPEMLDRAVLINAPFIFNALWSIVKPWLSQATLDKVQIHGKTGYHESFRTIFRVQDLPVSLGGLCSCPGGCVKNVPGTDFMVDGLQQVEVSNGAAYELPIAVPHEATVAWEFNVRAYDIKFIVRFKPSSGGAGKVVAEYLALTGQTYKDTFAVTEEGTLTIVWDNTFSFLRSKNVAYKVDLIAPPTASTVNLALELPSQSGTLEAAQAALVAQTAADLAAAEL